jgi:N-acetylgalactosamine-N,N'-diacetylbacillosaminyl-diphospho-undecaprenol 4-alpha-N-acetylgalactosaminyltransferase
MKVLFLCPSLVGAGVERRVCTLVNELERLNVDVRLGLLREEGEFLDEVSRSRLVLVAPDARVKRLLFALPWSRDFVNCILAIRQIRGMLQQIEPEVVVSFTLETTIPMYFVSLAGHAKRIAWVISEDSNTAAATVEACGSARSARIVQSLFGKIYRKASHISCVSKAVENTVQEVYRVDRSRLGRLANPLDAARVKKAIRTRLNPAGDSDYLLAVGRLVPIKQFDLLIRAFSEVRKRREIKLVILGEGPERDKLAHLVAALGLKEDVLFPGFVDNPWSMMAQAKLLVLTSKLEGFGNVIVESMAAGCPVIATRCGGPEELIQNWHNGILVDHDVVEIANAIDRVLADPQLSSRLVHNAWLEIESYAPNRIAAEFLALLQKVAIEEGLENPLIQGSAV